MDSSVVVQEGGSLEKNKEVEERNSLEQKSSSTIPPEVPEVDSVIGKRVSSDLSENNILEPREIKEYRHEDEKSSEISNSNTPTSEQLEAEVNIQREEQVKYLFESKSSDPSDKESNMQNGKEPNDTSEMKNSNSSPQKNPELEPIIHKEKQAQSPAETKSSDNSDEEKPSEKGLDDSIKESSNLEVNYGDSEGPNKNLEEVLSEEEAEPVFDGTEVPGMEANRSLSIRSLENDSEIQTSAWPDKAMAIKKFVREKSVVAVSSLLRRLSGKSDDGQDVSSEKDSDDGSIADIVEAEESSRKSGERSGWNPLSFIGISQDTDPSSSDENTEGINNIKEPIPMKGRIILYTKLGSQECKMARLFLLYKRLRYVEINIDVYPSRKLELEQISGSSAVPKIVFNEVLIGGLSELKDLEESGRLAEKIDYIISESPSFEAPLPPLSGEDDVSSSGTIDELAIIVRKMKSSIVVKDRFYKMRRFTNCFLGSEALDFLSEDQYLEREEAIEFGRKLGSKLFFQHVLDENIFDDGSHVYRFLDDDPLVSECQNIPRGIIEAKPKPITDISSRLHFMCCAIYEAYTSEDGRHVDYRSIHGSEEFARYLRIVEELQRVDLHNFPREEKLAFFINLYNMMAIHAILVWGHPTRVLERRKLFGEFKYVIGGCTYSLSAIQNGILRGNQRPPYNLTKHFGLKDKRFKVALPYPEPLVHFALVYGTRSSPALRSYSPGNIDKELMDAAHKFLTNGGLIVDFDAKVASVSRILKWFSVDFGKSDTEVLKHAANYLEPVMSQALLELLDKTQLKVIHQPYDWGLNH